QTGYAYTSQQDFQQKTGMSTAQAGAQGLITSIPQVQQQALAYQNETNALNLEKTQAEINSANASTYKTGIETQQLLTGNADNTDAQQTITNIQSQLATGGQYNYLIQGNGTLSSSDYKIQRQKFVSEYPNGLTLSDGTKITAGNYFDQQMFSYVD